MPILRILYSLLIIILLPFILPLGLVVAIRRKEEEGYFERFGFINAGAGYDRSVWFHCASVGEVRSISAFIKQLRAEVPGLKIIISTMTATGRKVAKEDAGADISFLIPVENSFAVKHLIAHFNTKAFFIVDTELWPNLVYAASSACPLYLINARMSDRTARSYFRFRMIFAPLLSRFTHIFAKSVDDAARFAAVRGKAEGITALGNLKFSAPQKKQIPEELLRFSNIPFLFAASTHGPEEGTVLDAFMKVRSQLPRLVIAPRHLSRVQLIRDAAEKRGLSTVLLSENDVADVVIVDSFGQLEYFYQMAESIFVGGSLTPVGGHNTFEALQYEKYVITGSYMNNFADIHEASLATGVATVVATADELAQAVLNPAKGGDFAQFFAMLTADSEKRYTTLTAVVKDALSRS